MPVELGRIKECLASFDFKRLFIEELGWNHFDGTIPVSVGAEPYLLRGVSEKRGMAVLLSSPDGEGAMADGDARRKIEREVSKTHQEHLIVFLDRANSEQRWQWVRRQPGKPLAYREFRYRKGQSGELLAQKLLGIKVALDEEEKLTLPDITGRIKGHFDVERVTKRFYEEFRSEHDAFKKLLEGIPDQDLQRWYVSVMLNRLMFVYFIQRKGLLDGDLHYLRNRLDRCRKEEGKDRFYRAFVCPLFFAGFAAREEDRPDKTKKLLGAVPYLNGGIFARHQIEELHDKSIQVPDRAFDRLFAFFDKYQWHLDERRLKDDNEINPEVLGYIFEKYINQKQMGAYYTKEDITGYIARNTIGPFLVDFAREQCKIAFEGERAIWKLLSDDPDRYVYEAVRKGMTDALPADVGVGLNDVSRRGEWNKPASQSLALPTEIWREVIARRRHYEHVREKLVNGQVNEASEMVTLNLDILRFVQDAIERAEGPDVLTAFWNGVSRVTVLDPTCGSGAFLFAALNNLDPLYEACLDRMAFFLEEWGDDGMKEHPQSYKLFAETLARVEEHPNHRYFVLKSIVVNNLFGVDMMEEAVEICKLRLFLKLVAQVDKIEEPLPDIDFNIRAGNSLVGFVSMDEVRKTQEQSLAFGKDQVSRIERQARETDEAFAKFRDMQTQKSPPPTTLAEAKATLRARLKRLTDELDGFLAGEYSGGPVKAEWFAKWWRSHQPFHWFAEFYGILKAGGFDVVIGNPPWAEYSTVKKSYAVRGYATERCGNLHCFCTERSLSLRSPRGAFSFIVQLPLASSSRMEDARKLLRERSGHLWLIPFDDRPGKLFEGLQHCRAVIFISRHTRNTPNCSTAACRYLRWATEAREALFASIRFTELPEPWRSTGPFPKMEGLGTDVVRKLHGAADARLGSYVSPRPTSTYVFYQEATQYWIKATLGLPYYAKDGKRGAPAHGRFLYAPPEMSKAILGILQSSAFYYYFVAFGDCFHLSDGLVSGFPMKKDLISDSQLVGMGEAMDKALRASAERKTINTRSGERITYDEFFAGRAKKSMDQVDRLIASKWKLSAEELDFIQNYDIKYRMGLGGGEDGDVQSED